MKVKIHYLFSKNSKIGSKIISWGTEHLTDIKNVPSHVAVLVHERWVFESTLNKGIRVIPYKKWLEINEEIAKIACFQVYRQYADIKAIYKKIIDKKYDYKGVTYLGIHLALNKYLSRDIPKNNKWESKDRYFCCEAVEKLTGIGPTQMKAPVQLLEEFTNGK